MSSDRGQSSGAVYQVSLSPATIKVSYTDSYGTCAGLGAKAPPGEALMLVPGVRVPLIDSLYVDTGRSRSVSRTVSASAPYSCGGAPFPCPGSGPPLPCPCPAPSLSTYRRFTFFVRPADSRAQPPSTTVFESAHAASHLIGRHRGSARVTAPLLW